MPALIGLLVVVLVAFAIGWCVLMAGRHSMAADQYKKAVTIFKLGSILIIVIEVAVMALVILK